MKSYLHKDKKVWKKTERTRQSEEYFLVWEVRGCTHIVAAAQMNFVSVIFVSRTSEENVQLYNLPVSTNPINQEVSVFLS